MLLQNVNTCQHYCHYLVFPYYYKYTATYLAEFSALRCPCIYFQQALSTLFRIPELRLPRLASVALNDKGRKLYFTLFLDILHTSVILKGVHFPGKKTPGKPQYGV